MSAPPNNLLLASAGTGKTFRLTHHLIDLLLGGADPGRVLATTFTRKAAGEILDRVLERLVEGATDPEKLAEINTHLVGNEATERACLELLASLARRLDRFQVRTLDAFFVHVGHLFALDLGLPAGWSIADEHQETRLFEEAIGRMLDEVPEGDLIELLRGIPREEGAQRSVRYAMRTAIDAARDSFLESPAEAWSWLVAPQGLEETTLETLIGTVADFDLPATSKGQPDSRWVKARAELLNELDARNWSGVLEAGLVKKVREGEDSYYGKTIEAELHEALTMILAHVRHELLEDLARRNRATHGLLTHFQRALDAVKAERGLLAFEDLPRALAPDGAVGPAALADRELDLDYRLDARIDHLLLDEFQDTAPVQWRILERLAGEILAEHEGGRTFFCVGDVKQSIYGWRSAEPRLLAGMRDWYGDALRREELVDNWRSSAVVLDTVNRVFRGVGASTIFEGDDKLPYREAALAWSATFEDHRARKDLRGAAVLLQARAKEEEEEEWEPVVELTVERVAELVDQQPQATVAVLLRSNKPIPRILERLLSNGLRASGEGGNPLTDSRAVLHALSALHLADHPGDTAAAFHVQHSPFQGVLDELAGKALEHPAAVSRLLRRRLQWEGLGDLCARFLPAVDGHPEEYGEWDRRRFRQLVDLAYTHESHVGVRASAFVDLVHEARVEDPSASHVKVMTVHASKGLEFDAVLLPELDEDLHPRRISVLTRRDDPRRRLEVCCVHPGTDVANLDPGLKELHDEQKRRALEEALCVLYVAMTRARNRLEMIVRESSRRSMSYARLLRDRLDVPAEPVDRVLWRHPDGSDAWFEPDPDEEPARPATALELELAPSTVMRSRPTRAPSREEDSGELRGRVLLARRANDSTARGTLIHRWMQAIEWLDDGVDEDALLELGAEIEPDREARRTALADLRAALGHAEVRAALTRPASGDLFDTVRVWRERPFSVVLQDDDGTEVLCSGAFDRVVLHGPEADPERVELLDYKTDRVDGEAIAVRVEHYRGQVESYRRALAAITGLEPGRIEASLLFLHPGVRARV